MQSGYILCKLLIFGDSYISLLVLQKFKIFAMCFRIVAQAKKILDANSVLLPLYKEYPAGLSTGELSELMNVSRITGRKYLLELQHHGKIKETARQAVTSPETQQPATLKERRIIMCGFKQKTV
jgi:hypothetical protein